MVSTPQKHENSHFYPPPSKKNFESSCDGSFFEDPEEGGFDDDKLINGWRSMLPPSMNKSKMLRGTYQKKYMYLSLCALNIGGVSNLLLGTVLFV